MQALGTMLPVHEHSPDHPFGQLLEDKSVKSSMKWEEALKLIQATVFTYFTKSQNVTISMVSQSPPSFHRVGARMCTDRAPVYIEIHRVLGCS